MKIYSEITRAVGHTPLVKLKKILPKGETTWAKLESFNHCSSIKDRLGRQASFNNKSGGAQWWLHKLPFRKI